MLNIANSNPDDLLRTATSLEQSGDLDGAEALCRQVLERESTHAVALHLLGTIALHRSQPQVAIEHLEAALRGRPDIPGTHAALAAAYMQAGRNDEALTHYRLALELDPEFATVRRLYTDLLAQLRRPMPPESDPAFAAPLARLAAAVSKSNRKLAARLFERSLDNDPEQPETLVKLGELLTEARLPQDAAAAFRAALAMKHQTADVHHGLAKALHKLFEFAEAEKACLAAQALDPNNLEIQWTLTQIQADRHKFDVAAQNIRAALAKDPNNKDLQFQLAAITGDKSISAMPAAQIASTFDNYAEKFDAHLHHLNYKGPQVILRLVTAAAPGKTFDVLDLGCGTGLCGNALRPFAKSLAGIDLSPRMIERSRGRGIYDRLDVLDVVSALHRETGRYDLVTASDVFTYMGDLDEAFAGAVAALRPGGLFAFWVERTDEPGFLLNRTTFRFTHNLAYLMDLAKRHGFREVQVDPTPLRTQFGRPVPAWTVLLQKKEA